MTPARRCALAAASVLLVLLALRVAVPEATERRGAALALLLPLGYAHQLGAWRRSLARYAGARTRSRRSGGGRTRVVRRVAGFACVAASAALLYGLARLCWPAVAFALALVAAWHVIENELAMARAAPGGRLPPLSRAPTEWGVAVAGSALALGIAASAPWWTHALLRAGVPPRFAHWSAEECVAALLLHHVLSFGLFAWRSGAALRPAERRRRRRALVALHAVPIAVALLLGFTAPTWLAALAAPGPYLLASVAHALHTAWQRSA